MSYQVPFGVVFSLPVWRVALRLRGGLEIPPAFCGIAEFTCSLWNAEQGRRCGKVLDLHGQHALTCPCEGQLVSRHDRIVRLLARALKRFGCLVRTERWCHELFDREKNTHARMDLVVFARGQTFYLDVTCGHCVSGKGTVNVSGLVARSASNKHDRYRTVVDGVRVTPAKLVPVALSSFGAVGREARGFFSFLGLSAALDELEDDAGPCDSRGLVRLCSFLAVLYSAESALAAYVSPANGPSGRRDHGA